MKQNDEFLCGQQRPTVEQTAWVIKHLLDAMSDTGSYRYLIYERMGYGPEAYCILLEAGGMQINNAFIELEELNGKSDKPD